MTLSKKVANEPGLKDAAVSQNLKLDALLGRIDLMAILTTLLGVALLGVAAVAMAVLELAKMLAGLWADSFDRWLILSLGLCIVWVAARWKKLCVF